MKIENIEQAIELINEAVPYSDQIRYNSIREDAIYFKWRGDSFKLTLCTGSVEEVGDGVLIGSNCAVLLRELIRKAYVNQVISR